MGAGRLSEMNAERGKDGGTLALKSRSRTPFLPNLPIT